MALLIIFTIIGMGFGEAIFYNNGWLIGGANKGLAAMFTMMNNARLAVGMQGVAIGEAATQKAVEYARERTQGKAPGYFVEKIEDVNNY